MLSVQRPPEEVGIKIYICICRNKKRFLFPLSYSDWNIDKTLEHPLIHEEFPMRMLQISSVFSFRDPFRYALVQK